MKDTLRPGLSRTETRIVDAARTIDFMGEDLRIYATPELLRDIEVTCRNLLLEYCDVGEDSVGVSAAFDHSAATPLGMTVRITATVAKVEGRRVVFDIVAADAVEEISRGQHTRFIVEMAKAKQRLLAKIAKAEATKQAAS
ncbi:MAG: thioesterase family protein [Acidobacteriia bacterium]|nr:thioesterase family protein [Methyloceanibacter sp.]MBX5470881.1 thioesterase family protein [Acetobacteraceae bacterium]MCL6491288.1 thioesterase family protein [Terriglobia bacterium]